MAEKSEAAPTAADVAWARAAHGITGLWPVLLGGDPGAPTAALGRPGPGRPRRVDLYPLLFGAIDSARWTEPEPVDLEAFFAHCWRIDAPTADDEAYEPADRLSANAPAGLAWPGPAPARTWPAHPDRFADGMTQYLLTDEWLGHPRLALVPAASSSAVLTALRYRVQGNPVSRDAILAAVRSWEQRFGARLIALKPDALFLSVAAEPADRAQAAHVACEHFALDPDIVIQCSDSFRAYVTELIGVNLWQFWWD